MHRKSWPGFIITIMLLGVMFLVIGIFAAKEITTAIILILMGLVLITVSLCVLRWYLKNKNTPKFQIYRDYEENFTKPQVKTETDLEDDKKFIKTIAKWVFRISAIILCINMICRISDAIKSKEYLQTVGTVTKVYTSSEMVTTKKGSVESTSYDVWIEYQPSGDILPNTITEIYNDDIFSEGDTVPVLYREKFVYDGHDDYVAKKDWLTRAYLPADKDYDLPLKIFGALFVISLLFCTDPVLEWYVNAQTNVTIKKEKS